MSNINDKNNESKNRTQTIVRALLLLVILAASVTALISLKQLTDDGPLTPEGFASRDSLRTIAHPDTTEVPGALPSSPASGDIEVGNNGIPVDSLLTGDERSPLDAGYEDGYYAGIIDGVSGDERASYDETSQFPKPEQRQAYTDAYRRGYAQGYQDGLEGKEFSLIPNQDSNTADDDDAPDAPAEKKAEHHDKKPDQHDKKTEQHDKKSEPRGKK